MWHSEEKLVSLWRVELEFGRTLKLERIYLRMEYTVLCDFREAVPGGSLTRAKIDGETTVRVIERSVRSQV